MIGFWTIHAVRGGLPQGIKTLESDGYIAFHITAELLTGMLCLVSGIALNLDILWSMPVALLSSGMLLYTSINSLAWREVKNKPVISLMFIVPAIIAVVSFIYLLTNI
ncbi:MAG: hypothetical protein JW762_09335 [Dehalococcoidales bacterium]|nr:hypothetical protein [Dehalococcoidales bacterium]